MEHTAIARQKDVGQSGLFLHAHMRATLVAPRDRGEYVVI
jgi:hypothetical protein